MTWYIRSLNLTESHFSRTLIGGLVFPLSDPNLRRRELSRDVEISVRLKGANKRHWAIL
jgi:hypothetical protein